jgi:phosphomannomutase
VDRLCAQFGCAVTETSVGFKNIAPELIEHEEVIFGVEESGGLGFRGHVPDRDGTLSALMICETLAMAGKPVTAILDDIYALIGGRSYFDRSDLQLTPEQRDKVAAALPSLEPAELAGQRVVSVKRIDGAKLLRADGSWLITRLSGTEPLVRVYAEAHSAQEVQALIEAGRQMILSAGGG